MKLFQLGFILWIFFEIAQYSKNFQVPVAAASQIKKPATIKELLRNLQPHNARGYVLQHGVYTRVELEPGKSTMVVKFYMNNGLTHEYVVYNLKNNNNDPYSIAGNFTQGSLLYLTYNSLETGNRIYSGWIISPDRSAASPVAFIEQINSRGVASSSADSSSLDDWPSEFDVNPYMQPLK